jgi:hypothetical protein
MQAIYAVTFAWNDDAPQMGCLDLAAEGFSLESGVGRDRLIRFRDVRSIEPARGPDRLRNMETMILRSPQARGFESPSWDLEQRPISPSR